MRVAEQMLRYLASLGITRIFGIVGRESDSILFTECPNLDFVLTRHEFNAGIIAISMSRFTGLPQVCFSTLGPGSTNLITALATARLDRYPLIAISAQIETNELNYNNAHQCVDGVSIAKPIVKFAHEIGGPHEVMSTLRQAVNIAMTEPRGPVFISIPNDILKATAEEAIDEDPARPDVSQRYSSADIDGQLAAAVSMLSESKHPLIVVGDGAVKAGAAPEIARLVDTHRIPAVSSYAAKGVLPPDNLLYYGAITPHMDAVLEFPALDTIFGPADCLLLIGYDLAEHLLPQVWTTGNTKMLIRLSDSPNTTPLAFTPDMEVVGPIEHSLRTLTTLLTSSSEPYDIAPVRDRIASMESSLEEDPNGLLPHQVLGVLNRHYKDYILANDVGQHRHASALFYRANRPLDFITSAGLSSFGTGLPLGIGAKLANPNRTVVVVAGDAGFHSGSGELETAKRLGLKLIILVYDNQKAGLIERYQMMGHHETNDKVLHFGKVDFAKLAEANGCQGITCLTLSELDLSLSQADSYSGPTVIQLPIYYPNLYINQYSRNYHIEA